MNPKQQLEVFRALLRQGVSPTREQKQWLIDQCIRYGSRVSLQARLAAAREGFATAGLQVAA